MINLGKHILCPRLTPMAASWQSGPFLWLHLSISPAKTLNPYFEAIACLVQKSQNLGDNFGREPNVINVPYPKQQVGCYFKIMILGQLRLFNF